MLPVSNLGMFGIDEFTSIINQPNSAILSRYRRKTPSKTQRTHHDIQTRKNYIVRKSVNLAVTLNSVFNALTLSPRTIVLFINGNRLGIAMVNGAKKINK